MSLTKRYIDDLQAQGIDPFVSDAEYDAEYMEFLREQERDRLAEEYLEAEKEAKEKGMFTEVITVVNTDQTISVTPVSVKTERKEKV